MGTEQNTFGALFLTLIYYFCTQISNNKNKYEYKQVDAGIAEPDAVTDCAG